MANFTAADVKKLREQTAAGMMDCKNALTEADGDFGKAVEILRVKGLKGITKREGRSASNGMVAAKLAGDTGVLVEVNCETDFVAKGDRFQALGAALVEHLIATDVSDVAALLASENDGRSVQALVDEASATLGEKIQVRRFARFAGAELALYLHKTSPDLPPQVGVLVELQGIGSTVGHDVAQHIAAFSPTFVSRDEVDAETVENERRIAEATAREEGKPEGALSKIVEGRVNGFFKENVLVEQAFAKDAKKTVKSVLDEAGVSVTRFARFRVGS